MKKHAASLSSATIAADALNWLHEHAHGPGNAITPIDLGEQLYGGGVSTDTTSAVSRHLSNAFRAERIDRVRLDVPDRRQRYAYFSPRPSPEASEEPSTVAPDQTHPFEAVIDLIAERVVERLQPQLDALLSRLEVDPSSVPPLERPVPRPQKYEPRLPKVVVVGPKGKQVEALEKEFAGVVNLACIPSHTNPKAAGSAARQADITFVWADYVSHAHQEQVRKAADKSRRQLVRGGLSTIKDRITEWVLTHEE